MEKITPPNFITFSIWYEYLHCGRSILLQTGTIDQDGHKWAQVTYGKNYRIQFYCIFHLIWVDDQRCYKLVLLTLMVTSTSFNVAKSDHKNWWQYIVRPLAPPSSLGTYMKMENRIYFSLYHTRAILTHGLYIFTPFLKTISLFSRRFFHKILSLCMVSIQERFLIKSGLLWRAYGICFCFCSPFYCIKIGMAPPRS